MTGWPDTKCLMAKSPEVGMASLIRNLEAKTGRSLDDWVATARSAGLGKYGQLVAFLKAEHGLSHGYANQVALRALAAEDAPVAGDPDPVKAQYQGGLREPASLETIRPGPRGDPGRGSA
jgi:hypothetical protein